MKKQINNVSLIKKHDRLTDLDEKLTSKHSKFHYANERD